MLKFSYVTLKLKAILIEHLEAQRNPTEIAGLKWHLLRLRYFGDQISVTTWTVFLTNTIKGGGGF